LEIDMETLIVIFIIIAGNFLVFLLIIKPFIKYDEREFRKAKRAERLKEYCQHHEVRSEGQKKFDILAKDYNYSGFRNLVRLILVVAILLILIWLLNKATGANVIRLETILDTSSLL
jgi:preprotein translocase subunit SecG